MTSPGKRREMDVMKLMMSDFQVDLVNDCVNEFHVIFQGPKESPYEGGNWKVRVELPDGYPYKSPSIGFVNRIYHPNVDEQAGSTWSPMFDLINVFEVFLPQLLLYPNPTDPLNGEAASLLLREPQKYNKKVKDYVQQYAKKSDILGKDADDVVGTSGGEQDDEDDDDLSMSDGDRAGFLSDSDDDAKEEGL